MKIQVSNKLRRIGAWIGIVLLLGLYAATIVGAVISSENSKGLFMASLFCTFAVPLWIFLLQMFYKRSHPETDSNSLTAGMLTKRSTVEKEVSELIQNEDEK